MTLRAASSANLINRRAFVKGVGGLGAALSLSATLPPRGGSARGGDPVNFQTSAGTRFGTPNKFLIADYNAAHQDAQIVMDTVPVQNYFPKLSTEIASKASNIDCFTTITNLLYPAAKTGRIVAFDDIVPKDVLAELLADISPRYMDTWRFEGKLYGLPNDSNAQWTFYRKDLLEKAGVTLPKTWGEAPAVAKALTKNGVYGYTASLRRGEYAGAHFSTVFYSMGGEWYDPSFHPALDTDTGMQAVEAMLAMMPYADPGSVNAGEDDTAKVLASGTAAWAPVEWGRADLTDPAVTPLASQIGTAVPPAGPNHPAAPCLGGQTYAIASWSSKQKQALDYILYATSKAVMHTFVQHQGQPARTSALTDPANVKIDPYFPTLQQVLAQGHPFPAIPESYQMLVEIGNNIADIITKSVSPKAGLQAANSAVGKILKNGGYQK